MSEVAASMWGPGWTIAGRYRLVEPLGRGAMGSVWRAEHLVLRAPVAIKLIEPALIAPASEKRNEVTRRFLIEAQAAAALRSPHVVQILDYGVERDVPYIAMELLDGQTLAQRLAGHGILPYSETARVISHIARALGKAHEAGIVHRDLKPENVFLIGADEEQIVKVLDFGIAKTATSFSEALPGALPSSGPVSLTRLGCMLGTPAYMSPEQMMGHLPVDYRSDLWALAVIAFECVCGQRPFHAVAPLALAVEICSAPLPVPSKVARVPPGFDRWFARAVAREPAERFQSSREMAQSLRAILEQPGLTPPVSQVALREEVATEQTTLCRPTPIVGPPASNRVRRARRVAVAAALGVAAVSIAVLAAGALHRPRGAAASDAVDQRRADSAEAALGAPAPDSVPAEVAQPSRPLPSEPIVVPQAPAAPPRPTRASAPLAPRRAPSAERAPAPPDDPRLGF